MTKRYQSLIAGLPSRIQQVLGLPSGSVSGFQKFRRAGLIPLTASVLPGLAVVVVATSLATCAERRPTTSVGDERRVVAGVGSARSPVLSRDGAAIAFAAVGAGYANPQVWIARADGSAPPRPLTSGTPNNYDPEFSPDGRSIYFTSSRQPQGVYRIPSTGGEPKLVVAGGYAARFSPDGKTLVIGSSGKLVAHPQPEGASFELLPEVANSYAPVWSPDGTRVLATVTNRDTRKPDWWIAPLSGSAPVRTSLADDLRRQGFNDVATNAWLEGNCRGAEVAVQRRGRRSVLDLRAGFRAAHQAAQRRILLGART